MPDSPTFTHADILAAVVAAHEESIRQYDDFIRANERTTCPRLMRFIKYQRTILVELGRLIASRTEELAAIDTRSEVQTLRATLKAVRDEITTHGLFSEEWNIHQDMVFWNIDTALDPSIRDRLNPSEEQL